jgi:predicted transcriptional regulator
MKEIAVPLSVLTDRKLSILEVIVEYLHEKKSLSFHEIAVLTKRDDRTIWTCYNRAKKKRMRNAI